MRGCIVLAGTIQPVRGVFLFTLLYNTFTVLSIQLMQCIVYRIDKNAGECLCNFLFCEADNYTRTKRMYGEIKEIVIIL